MVFSGYLQAMRFHAVGISLSYVMIGCFIGNPLTSLDTYLSVLLVAIPLSAAGLMANDVLDLEVDRTNPDLSQKPLVSGIVPKRNASILVVVLLLSSIILSLLLMNIESFPWLVASILVGAVYNLWNKNHLALNFLGNGYAFTFCIYGGVVVGGTITPLLLLFAFGCYMRLTIGTVLEGSIKDYEFDKLSGCRTAGTMLGMKVLRNGKLALSPAFKVFMYAFDSIYWVMAVYIVYLGGFSFIHLVIIGLIAILMVGMLSRMPSMYADRLVLRKALFSYEVLGQLSLGVLLSLFSPLFLAFLAFAIPSGWLGMFIPIVYGRRMPTI